MPTSRLCTGAFVALVLASALGMSPAVAAAGGGAHRQATAAPAAEVEPFLADQLAHAATDAQLLVFVHGTGTDIAPALAAIDAEHLTLLRTMDLVGVAVAVGSPDQIRGLISRPGITYLQGDAPLSYALGTAHLATRYDQARSLYTDASGHAIDGTGVSIAIIDSGIDGTHPFFKLADGSSKVKLNLKSICPDAVTPGSTTNDACLAPVPSNDSDSSSAGGHGTHVAGIAAGVDVTTTSPRVIKLHGSAPGATLIALSVGESLSINAASQAFYWVLQHHLNPCAGACPAIRVTSNSYGPVGGGSFSPSDVVVGIQDQLADAGVVSVWAAGNDGGTGTGMAGTPSTAQNTNPRGQDPKPGIVMVANYNDGNTGTRDGALDASSSRGVASNKSTYPDISAPGTLITSACRPYLSVCATGLDPVDGPAITDKATFNTISGTSMATPYIAGIAADLFQAKPTLTAADVENILEDTAYKFTAGAAYVSDPANADNTTSFDKGHGLVDAVGAVASALNVTPPAYVPVPCSADGAFTDPEGDASSVVVDTNAPPVSDPALDIRKVWVTSDVSNTVTFHVRVTDLTPPTAQGQYFEFQATIGGKVYGMVADRETGFSDLYEVVDYGGTGGTRRTLATASGSFDDVSNEVTLAVASDLPRTVPAVATPHFAPGDAIAGLTLITRRDFFFVVPNADGGAGPCPFIVGAASQEVVDPGADVPEVPAAVALPLLGLAITGGWVLLRRRRSRPALAR